MIHTVSDTYFIFVIVVHGEEIHCVAARANPDTVLFSGDDKGALAALEAIAAGETPPHSKMSLRAFVVDSGTKVQVLLPSGNFIPTTLGRLQRGRTCDVATTMTEPKLHLLHTLDGQIFGPFQSVNEAIVADVQGDLRLDVSALDRAFQTEPDGVPTLIHADKPQWRELVKEGESYRVRRNSKVERNHGASTPRR